MSYGEMSRLGQFEARRLNPSSHSETKTYHLPTWKNKDDKARLEALRLVALKGGREPDMATLAVNICREAGAQPRDYKGQAAAILAWVQKNIYYANEPGERLQDPLYTLRVRYGDCDDMAILLAALYESIRLPWRYVLSGRNRKGKLVRWVEGTSKVRAQWSHIYVVVGYPPYTPKQWFYAEPTLANVPLGWDVVEYAKTAKEAPLPELAGPDSGDQKPFLSHVYGEVKSKLHPRSLLPTLIVGMVVGGITLKIQKLLKKGKKKEK